MGIRSGNDPYGGATSLVDQMLGTAYPTVKAVQAKLPELSALYTDLPTLLALPALVGAAANAHGVPLESFGTVDSTGATDMSTLINTAIAETAADGVQLLIGPGSYLASSMIKLVSGAKVRLQPDSIILRDFVSVGVTGLIGQESYSTPLTKPQWFGGVVRNPSPSTLNGRSFGLYMDDGVIEDDAEWSELWALHG